MRFEECTIVKLIYALNFSLGIFVKMVFEKVLPLTSPIFCD